MHVLVTGGAGFIGSHLVDFLVAHGHSVTVLDNLSRGRMSNLDNALACGNVRVITEDLLDSDLEQLIADTQPEVIFHLAAQIDVRRSVAEPIRIPPTLPQKSPAKFTSIPFATFMVLTAHT